jgi:hypothetical protein
MVIRRRKAIVSFVYNFKAHLRSLLKKFPYEYLNENLWGIPYTIFLRNLFINCSTTVHAVAWVPDIVYITYSTNFVHYGTSVVADMIKI